MRIERIEIDGFGAWSGLRLDGLAERLTVVYGSNEAGKTTLLEFIRSTLYGFSPERRARYLPPVHGGPSGGRIAILDGDDRLTVERLDNVERGPGGGLAVYDDEGERIDPARLVKALGRIDETIFTHVFAIGLREIQDLGGLAGTEAARRMYDLSTGIEGASLPQAIRELSALRERLLSRGDGQGRIPRLLAERDRLRGLVDELRGQLARYALLASERRELESQVRAVAEQTRAVEREARCLESAAAIHDQWRERDEAARELGLLGGRVRPGAPSMTEWSRVERRLRRERARLAKLRKRAGALRRQARELGGAAAIARLAPRIEALIEQAHWISALDARVKELDAEVSAHEDHARRVRGQLGLASGGGVASVPGAWIGGDRRTLAPLKSVAAKIRAARDELQRASDALSTALDSAAEIEAETRAALDERGVDDVVIAVQQAGELVTRLRRRLLLDERIDNMGGQQRELRARHRDLHDDDLVPAKKLVAMGAWFVVGVVACLAGLLLPSSLTGDWGWPLAVFGGLVATSVVAWKFVQDRSHVSEQEACRRQLESLREQIETLQAERDELDRKLPSGGGPIVTRLQTAERELTELESLLPIEGKRQDAQRALAAAEEREAAARGRLAELEESWGKSLASAGLPADLSPAQVREHVAARRALADVSDRLEHVRQERQLRQGELAGVVGRVRQLLAEASLEPTSERPSDQLQQLRDAMRRHAAIAAERDALLAEASRALGRRRKQRRAIARWRRRRRGLLRRAGAANGAEFRQFALAASRADGLRRRIETLSHEIDSAVGGAVAEAEVHTLLESATLDELQSRARLAASDSARQREQSAAANRRIGALEHEMLSLAADRRAGNAMLDLDAVEQQLREAIEQWRVAAVTGTVLERLRRLYESDRQPETLVEASSYLERMTEGRYVRVWTPLDRDDLLVDDAAGRALGVDVLSSGAREQLFLALRLALAAGYARRGVDLPLVLDDVLVNFDAGRAKAAARLLRDIATAGRQVFLFTCHEHLLKLFKSLKATTIELPTCEPTALHETAAAPRPAVVPPPPDESDLAVAQSELGATAGDAFDIDEWREEEDSAELGAIVDDEAVVGLEDEYQESDDYDDVAAYVNVAPPVDEFESEQNGRPRADYLDEYANEPNGFAEVRRDSRRNAVVRNGRAVDPFATASWLEPVQEAAADASTAELGWQFDRLGAMRPGASDSGASSIDAA